MTGTVTWTELVSQPEAWRRLLGRLEAGDVALPLDPAAHDATLLFGSGSSYYLALAAADWMRRRGLDARAVPSCEVILDAFETGRSERRRLAIGLSRSGRSSELLLAGKALKAAGAALLGVTATDGSEVAAIADATLVVPEGREDGLVMLRSFTGMLLALQWLTGGSEDRAMLAGLPEAGEAFLRDHAAPLREAANARAFDRFVFLGSGPAHAFACEAGLKIQEMAIATSEAYHSLDYRHGPKACADAKTAVLIFALPDAAHGAALARDVAALGATVIVVGPDVGAYPDAHLRIPTPAALGREAGATLGLMAAQVFAHATALRRGADPDAPVNLARVVTL